MERCKAYSLTLVNNLDEETSIHTHGLHISGEDPGDNVINHVVNPGDSYTYTYQIPCDHASGTFWYHPHTSTTAGQLSKGLSGALIVEQGVDNPEGAPEWITSMR
eukprot:14946506-Ditylum_brightwellii.AAC.1